LALQPGTHIGSFEILSRLGAGGMGEVYRARDTKLGRDVALKALPDLFATDAERLGRFQREAQVLASLNHPHIAAIYGVEQSGGSQFLILELVEGETLADRLTRTLPSSRRSGADGSGLPLAEALSIARQIADALQAAHEKGIVHRDLKPANIALTHDGQVKVLDFGLAKLEANGPDVAGPAGSAPDAATMSPLAGLSQSPTMVTPAMTAAGMVLGTAPYMSPEQAKGRAADKRSDVWAFGCLLYEMLAGKPAFGGEDVSDTLANVLKRDPDWSALPPGLAPPLRALVQRCLDKDRRKRTADISVAAFILDDPEVGAARVSAAAAPGGRPRWWSLAATGAAALVAGAALTTAVGWYVARPGPSLVSRFTITSSGPAAFVSAANDRELAMSPDGRRVAYVGANGTIFVRAFDRLDATPILGLGLPRGLFFSPDGQWIGFFDAATSLKKVAVAGGAAITLCRVNGPPRGATWGRDDTIVFATNDPASGLLRVPAGGGDPTVLTTPNHQNGEVDHWWPEFLPDANAVLFTIVPSASSIENARIAVLDLKNGKQTILVEHGSDARYVASGHLVYVQAGTARAVAFDRRRLTLTGTPSVVLPQVVTTRFGAGELDVANDGTLVYLPRGAPPPGRTLVWVDRQGHEEATAIPARPYQSARFSPDGKRIALEADGDIWIWDVAREALTRLTFDPALDQFPVWTADGLRILFGSDRTSNGQANLFAQAADGSGSATRLTESPNQQFPMSVTPDGTELVFRESAPSLDLMVLSLAHPAQSAKPLLHSPAAELNGEVSPDGRWLAYQSNESGRFEISVRPFPNVDAGHWQVSTDGGIQPLWARNGQELFYVAPASAVLAVRVERGNAWSAGTPTKMFDDRYYHGAAAGSGRSYDVSPDGRRFLMIKQGTESPAPTIVVVQNWFEDLKRLSAAR
jgi:eukaryotic-like serine/threonine-protein kinase